MFLIVLFLYCSKKSNMLLFLDLFLLTRSVICSHPPTDVTGGTLMETHLCRLMYTCCRHDSLGSGTCHRVYFEHNADVRMVYMYIITSPPLRSRPPPPPALRVGAGSP